MQNTRLVEENTSGGDRPVSSLSRLQSIAVGMLDRVRAWRIELEPVMVQITEGLRYVYALSRAVDSWQAGMLIDVLREEEGIAEILEECYGIQATPENIEALWRVLRQPGWRKVPSEKVNRYLSVATYCEAARIRRDIEKSDRGSLSSKPVDRHQWEARTRSISRTTGTNSLRDLATWEEVEQILAFAWLMPVERRILELLRSGCSPAEALCRVGAKWTTWQNMKRKISRRMIGS